MSRGVNRVFLLGYFGRNPERRELPSGTPVCNVTLATHDARRDGDGGERKTEWHRLVFFDRLAEVVCLYLHKGSQVHVEGRLRTRKWQDRSGQDRYTTEVVVTELEMLGGGDSGAEADDRAADPAAVADTESTHDPRAADTGRQAPRPSAVAALLADDDDGGDDLPF